MTKKLAMARACSSLIRARDCRSARSRNGSPSRARTMRRNQVILANLCGRGDKDIFTVAEALGVAI